MTESLSMRQTAPDLLIVSGELNRANISLLIRYLRNLNLPKNGTLALQLDALEISQGAALASFVSILRELRTDNRSLTLVGAPQLLGHNLYRANLLNGKHAIALINMREDEAYG
jgi:ABC-type transporter Mla MlaB component